MREFLQDTVEL